MTGLILGLALAQIGEFAFVLAAHGKALGLVSIKLHKLLLHTTVVSLMLTPFMIKFSAQGKTREACSRGLSSTLEEHVGIDMEDLRYYDSNLKLLPLY